MRLHLPSHADAGVANANARVGFCRHAAKYFSEIRAGRDRAAQGESATIRHGVAGIDTEIEEHLVELAFISRNWRQIRLKLEVKVDCLRKCRLQHPFEFAHDRV